MLFNIKGKFTPKKRLFKFVNGLFQYPCANCGAKQEFPHIVSIQGNNHCYCSFCKKIVPVSDLFN